VPRFGVLVGVYYLYGWYLLNNSCFQNVRRLRKEVIEAGLISLNEGFGSRGGKQGEASKKP